MAVATQTAVLWDVTPRMFNVLPPLQGTRMTVAARPRTNLGTEIHGGILDKTAILIRHEGKKEIILKIPAVAAFVYQAPECV